MSSWIFVLIIVSYCIIGSAVGGSFIVLGNVADDDLVKIFLISLIFWPILMIVLGSYSLVMIIQITFKNIKKWRK